MNPNPHPNPSPHPHQMKADAEELKALVKGKTVRQTGLEPQTSRPQADCYSHV